MKNPGHFWVEINMGLDDQCDNRIGGGRGAGHT